MDNVTFHSELSIIGKSYLALGIFGITCNLIDLVAILLLKDDSPLNPFYFLLKDDSPLNPFYFFMLNLCIADLLCLTGLACYTGLTFCRVEAFLTTFLQRFFGFLIDANYYSSGWFHFLISLSRFLVFGEYSGVFMLLTTKNYMIGIVAFIWTFYGTCAFSYLLTDQLVYILDPTVYTWYYNMDMKWSSLINTYDTWHNIITMALILVTNISTLIKVRKQSKQIVPLANNRSGNLEIKLFVQCLISSSIYCGSATSFAIFAQINQLPNTMLLVAHLLWILDHVNNSILFLLMDKDLRRQIGKLTNLKLPFLNNN